MNHPASPQAKPRTPVPLPFHYAWLIVAVTFFASFNGAGIRVVPTVLIHPLEADFGWARSAITFGISPQSSALRSGRSGGGLVSG